MNVLISGGSRGIGRACVERFCADGHTVTFLYNKSCAEADELCRKTGATSIQCDVSKSCEVARAVTAATKEMGSIDVLVNNAGVADFCLFDMIDDEKWQKMLDVDLSGAFYLCREVAKSMISEKSGRIVNVGSMWGKVGAACEVHYSAAKAGLRGMTLALAKELGPSGITVNCVEPGVIATQMNSHLGTDDIADICESTPLGRVGEPCEVAELVYFLASDKAAFITGQCIGIDGGFAI